MAIQLDMPIIDLNYNLLNEWRRKLFKMHVGYGKLKGQNHAFSLFVVCLGAASSLKGVQTYILVLRSAQEVAEMKILD